MNKLLLVISIILTILFTYCSYYGIDRYIKINSGISKLDTTKYLKTERAMSDNKIIVSIYCPDNFNTVEKTILSLLDQTTRPDQIIITSDKKIDIPTSLTDNNIIISHVIENNPYGQNTSIISPLLREKDANTIVIAVSYNTIYGIDFIENMVDTGTKHPECIIYNKGYVAKIYAETGIKQSDINNDVIDVASGVLFRPKFFTHNIIKDTRFKYPDLLLSIYAISNGIYMVKSDNIDNYYLNTSIIPKDEFIINAIYFPSF